MNSLGNFKRHNILALNNPRTNFGHRKSIKKSNIRCMAISTQDELKQQAANKAVEYVKSGMVLGLGTGSTAAFAVQRIGDLMASGELKDIVGVPTSIRTLEQAKSLGIPLATLDEQPKLDLAIDGADEIDPSLDVIKGRGGALLRERMVEAAADKFVCIVDESKVVDALGYGTIPIEVVQFCWRYNKNRLTEMFKEVGCKVELREEDGKPYITDNGNYILDLTLNKRIKNNAETADKIIAMEGIVDHGLFLNMVDVCIVAKKDGVEVKTKN